MFSGFEGANGFFLFVGVVCGLKSWTVVVAVPEKKEGS